MPKIGNSPIDILNRAARDVGIVKSWIIQQALVTKSVDIEASQTGTAIWTPASGKKFVITDIILSTSAAGLIIVFDGTDDAANRVLKISSDGDGWGLTKAYIKPRISAVADNVLKYTTGTVVAGYLTVHGYEV